MSVPRISIPIALRGERLVGKAIRIPPDSPTHTGTKGSRGVPDKSPTTKAWSWGAENSCFRARSAVPDVEWRHPHSRDGGPCNSRPESVENATSYIREHSLAGRRLWTQQLSWRPLAHIPGPS